MAPLHFVDSSFLVARFNPRDRSHEAARRLLGEMAERTRSRPRLVLTDYIFDELITAILSRTRRHDFAARAGQALRTSRTAEILVIDRVVIEAAWALFLRRPDKMWSLTDCTSFVVMKAFGIDTALAFDANFREAGFATLP